MLLLHISKMYVKVTYVAARSLRSLRSNYNYSLLIETCHCLKWNFEKNTYLQYID